MDFLFTLFISFCLLIFSTFQGYFVGYPLLASMILFTVILLGRGFEFKGLLRMAFLGSQKSFPVLNVFLLVGAVTAIWMASGTVPAIVYYGIRLINPAYFILAAFILSSLVSLLIGTSFGTVSTIGVALMIMTSGSEVNVDLVAGAIISGAYFGDRCSPMSSSANLIATVTKTKLYTNIQNMWMTAIFPLVISIFLYWFFSLLNPIQIINETFLREISNTFNINLIVLLPAAAILVLSILQVEVKLSMLVSIGIAIAIAIFYQHYTLLQVLRFMLLGFLLEEPNSLKSILIGGGILSMVKVSIVVIISTAFVGIFAGTKILKGIEDILERTKSRSSDFFSTLFIGIGSAAFGCTQTIAILLTQELVEKKYQKTERGNYKLALDLENTVVVISPLIPWNIAGLVPATILMTGPGFIPFAFYLYLIPILSLIQIKLNPPAKLKP